MSSKTPILRYKGKLEGHGDWVTSISIPTQADAAPILASGSRDKKVIIWDLSTKNQDFKNAAHCAFSEHSQPVSDVVLSAKGDFVLAGSWDKTLRLWDLQTKQWFRSFTGHTSDVTSCTFSPDNRQIISASRDKTIRIWNTLGQCKFTLSDSQHSDWISCVRFSPDMNNPVIVSCGWDKVAKVWDLSKGVLKCDLLGHNEAVNTVTISPDGSLCASGGKDGLAMLWDVTEGMHLYALDASSPVNALSFSPCQYWLAAATDEAIKIWDLEKKKILCDIRMEGLPKEQAVMFVDKKKQNYCLETLQPHPNKPKFLPWCTSLSWSIDGDMLFAGSTNGKIYVFECT